MKVALCALVVSATCASPYATYGAPRVRIKGSARLDAHASRERGHLILWGTVLDDAGRPLPGARVSVALVSAADHKSVTLPPPSPCPRASATIGPTDAERSGTLPLTADDKARFCVELDLPVDRYVAHIEARPSLLVDAAQVDLPVDLAAAPVMLRFEPEPAIINLDEEVTSVEVVTSTDSERSSDPVAGLLVTLATEVGTALASAQTDSAGRARFAVPAVLLGPPGRGELRATCAGSGVAAPASRTAHIERRTRVELVAAEASGSRLPPASPEDGIVLHVDVTARCARHGCAGSPGGVIEARVGDSDDIAAASVVEGGQAQVALAFAASGPDVTLRVRYLPEAPWFEPAGELVLVQPVRPPGPWRKVLLALAAAAAIAWVALLRLPLRTQTRVDAHRPSPAGPAEGLEIVRGAAPTEGWTGRIADAHDGAPIAHARVSIERRGFDRLDVVAETTCDERGRFFLSAVETRPGDELVAAGVLHLPLRRPAPPPSELAVNLVLRRRALIDRLVAWARRRGAPYDAQPEATPGHVQRAAGSNPGIRVWAGALEQAAYGVEPVDEVAQAQVDELAPADDVDGARRRSL